MRHMDRFGSVAAGKEAKLSAARKVLGVRGQAGLVAAYRVRLLPQQVNQGTITEGPGSQCGMEGARSQIDDGVS